nr:glycerate kinase [Bacillus subtilis]
MKRGIDIVLEAVDFENIVQDADLVITGEGRIDSQTVHGKTPIGVAKAAKSYDVPVIGIAGSVSRDSDAVYQHGIDALFSIVPGSRAARRCV